MHRFFLPVERCGESSLTLTGDEAHHAANVLRVRHGDRVTVLDGAGHELVCEVSETGRKQVRLDVLARHDLPVPRHRITLLVAVTKGRSMDLVVQKATELGAARLVPVITERSVPQFDPAEASRKVGKWQAVAIEAIKQCGSPWLPQIEAPAGLASVLARNERFDLALVGSLHAGAGHPRESLRSYRARHGTEPRDVAVWVGPEGDFTPAELGAIVAAGASPITLGPLVLRAETAVIYCLSFLSYELSGR